MGIPLILHPKHMFSKIHGLSESESSSDWEEELDELLQLGKDIVPAQQEVDSNKNVFPNSGYIFNIGGQEGALEKDGAPQLAC